MLHIFHKIISPMYENQQVTVSVRRCSNLFFFHSQHFGSQVQLFLQNILKLAYKHSFDQSFVFLSRRGFVQLPRFSLEEQQPVFPFKSSYLIWMIFARIGNCHC